MPLTQDQARSLLTKAKASKPSLTADEARSLLSEANRRVDSQPQAQVEQGPQRNTIQNAVDYLGLGTIASNIGALGLAGQGDRTTEVSQKATQIYKQSQDLINQAKIEKDPAKKTALLNRSRAIMQGSEANMNKFQEDLAQKQMAAGVSEADLQRGQGEFLARRGLGQTAELASFLVPGKLAGQGLTAGARIAGAAGTGALAGGLQGLASAGREAENFGEGAGRVVTGSLIGGVLGAGLQGIGEVGKKIFAKGTPKEAINLSDRLNETKRVIREGEATLPDKLRASQFLKYKNKQNDLINETEVARVLDDIGMQYKSTDQLESKAGQLAQALQNVKKSSLATQKGTIDVSKTPEIFMAEASKSFENPTKLKKMFYGIVKQSSNIQNLDGADMVSADKLASELGKEARLYYGAWQRNGDPINQHLYMGFNNAKNAIRDQIDTNFAANISFTPEALQRVSKFSPDLAKAIESKALGMADINYIQAMLNNAGRLAKDTTIALKGAGQQVLGGKGVINIPLFSQVANVAGQGLDVLLSPAQAAVRTQTAQGLANIPNILENLGATGTNVTGKVLQSAVKAKPIVPSAVSALQRMIDLENKSKLEKKQLR